jgi:hypothetical protein
VPKALAGFLVLKFVYTVHSSWYLLQSGLVLAGKIKSSWYAHISVN